MPVLTGRVEPIGLVLDVKIMQSHQRVAALKRAGRTFSSPLVVRGLVDTGASSTCLDRYLIANLGLQQTGVVSIHTPSTGLAYETRSQYDACLVLGETKTPPLLLTISVIESDFAAEGFLALIGRDVLQYCRLIYDGPRATFTLEY